MSIQICGLGPAGPELISAETKAIISNSNHVFVRTKHHPAVASIDFHASFDSVYEANESYEETYKQIAETLIAEGSTKDIVYATPGSPQILEDVVALLTSQTEVKVTTSPAMSFLDLCWDRLGVDPVKNSVTLANAGDFEPNRFSTGPILVTQVFNTDMASKLKLSYQNEIDVTVLTDLGSETETVTTMPISKLDQITATNRTTVYIPHPGIPEVAGMDSLIGLISRLRKECPWDAKQNHESLVKHLEEETQEVIEAIHERHNSQVGYANFAEELGDLLLQILLHSEIASEGDFFDISDVANALHDKMIRRHPHVFGDSTASTLEELEQQWKAIKEAEKGKNS